ncbi:MAG TPA: response regulator [Steroidobacteraceae bacterium]|nr:response regulator [Steroidobacteraceae bacterium]
MSTLQTGQSSASAPARVAGEDSAPAQASILLVDDQPARLLAYEAVLHGLGVQCVRALSGPLALERLLDQQFAAILLDVNMPEMDGFEVARLVREHPRLERTPIIFVTAVNVTEFDRMKGYELGAIDYIEVPVVPEILRSKVAVLVELHQRRGQLQALNAELNAARAKLAAEHEKALAERDAQLHALFEHPSDLTGILKAVRDESGAIVDWFYTNVNRNAADLMGRSRDEIIGRRVSELVPQRASTLFAHLRRVVESREIVRYDSQFAGRDLVVTLFVAGDDYVVSTARDVTEGRRAENALRASEARYRAVVDNAPVAVAHNALGGRFEYVNKAFCDLVGYDSAELLTMSWQDITHPEDVAADQSLASSVVEGELPHYTIDKRYIRRDGSIVWVKLFGNILFDDLARPVQGLAVAIDITERLQNERRKDEFLAMLAHELRNPVAPIASSAELLSRLVPQEKQRALVGIIQRQAVHLGRLLDDLLDVARITQGRIELRREVIDVVSCVQLAIETAEPLIRSKGHQLTLTQMLDPIYVSADKVRLGQCIANVLVNAAKYTPDGGEIRIRPYVDGNTAVVEVSDNGIGIAPEFLPRIFDLFAQSERGLDRSQGGLGVGLTVCKQIVELHGGSVVASSPGVGRGATFTLRQPLAERPPATTRPADPQPDPLLRVLIVDDNRDAADSLAMLLQFEGRQTLCVYSGEEALQVLAAFNPQLVLLDIGLPGIDGYEVARRLKEAAPELHVIALSGYGQLEDRQRSAAAGFDGHLVKPVDLAALKHALALAAPG